MASQLRTVTGDLNSRKSWLETWAKKGDTKSYEGEVKKTEDVIAKHAQFLETAEGKPLKADIDAHITKTKQMLQDAINAAELSTVKTKMNYFSNWLVNSKDAKYLKEAEQYLVDKDAVFNSCDEGKKYKETLQGLVAKAKGGNEAAAAAAAQAEAEKKAQANLPKYGQPVAANGPGETNIRGVTMKINSLKSWLTGIVDVIERSGAQAAEDYIVKADQVIANNTTFCNSTPEGKKLLEEFSAIVKKAKQDLESNRHLDTSAEREALLEAAANWSTKLGSVALKNADGQRHDIQVSKDGMSKKTFINANTTTMQFADPGETITVLGPKGGGLTIPQGAVQVVIRNGAVTLA